MSAPYATAGLITQASLVARLRWRIFINSLRNVRERISLAGNLINTVLLSIAGLVIGAGAAIGGFYVLQNKSEGGLVLILWGILLVWQFVPVMTATISGAVDMRNLLRFPLRFSTYCVLQLAYGLSEPAGVMALFWTGCLGLGMFVSRPSAALWIVPALGLFALMNLILERAVLTWFDRLLSNRRVREAVFVLFILAMISTNLIGPMVQRYGKRATFAVQQAQQYSRFLPPGVAAEAILAPMHSEFLGAGESFVLLAGYTLAFAGLLGLRLHAQYLGEDLGETQRVVPVKPATKRVAAIPVSGAAAKRSLLDRILPPPLGALLQRELIYVKRNNVMLLNLVLPPAILFFVVFGAMSGPRNPGSGEFLRHAGQLGFPIAVAYASLIFLQVSFNGFAYEGAGVQMLYVAPVRFRDVLLAKNLLLMLMMLFEAVVVGAVVTYLAGPPGPAIVLGTLLWLFFSSMLSFSLGNWASIRFPRRFDFGQFRRRTSGFSSLLALIAQMVTMMFAAIVYLLSLLLGSPWFIPLIFLVLSAAAVPLYFRLLGFCAEVGLDQREPLIAEMTKVRNT